ncbi:MAG: hypothetical protein Q9179_004560 [Wetmoreana sp. 5 TL-2023]
MSGFTPIAQEAHVCLRCRFRLAAVNTRPPRSVRPRSKELQRRTFTTQTQHLQEHAQINDSYPTEQNIFHEAATVEANATHKEDDIQLPNDGGAPRNLRDSGYYFKRANLYSRDALGITTLGRPAEVLRIRDRPPRSAERKWWLFQTRDGRQPSSPEPLTSSDILERVNSERGLVSAARANENIEALREEWLSGLKEKDQLPTEAECYDLGKRLHDGFTTKQLLGYLNRETVSSPPDLMDLNKPFRSPSITRSDWRVGTTFFPGDTGQRLQSAVPKSGYTAKTSHSEYTLSQESRYSKVPVKYTVVNKIMRQCWHIKSREELQSVGEVDIQIPEANSELIASHKRGILRQLAVEYDAKVDFSKAESIIRITANQSTCAASLKMLTMVLDEIACYEMDLEVTDSAESTTAELHALLSDSLLREIERSSSTAIRWRQSGTRTTFSSRKILIYYLGNDPAALEETRRLLRQSLRPARAKKTGAFFGGTRGAIDSLTPAPVEAGSSLPLTDRGMEWYRMSSASNERLSYGQNTARPPTNYHPTKALNGIRRHTQASSAFASLDNDQRDNRFWHMSPFQESSAILGRLLYPAKTITPKDAFLRKLTHHHVLATDVPGVRRNLEFCQTKLDSREELHVKFHAPNEIVLRDSTLRDLPDLELRLAVLYQEREVTLKSVRLILEDQRADLLLPHEQADLRFVTQTYINAKADSHPRILDFVKSSELDDASGDPLKTPRTLSVGIPRQLLAPSPPSEEPVDSEILVDYSLASIESHSILHCRPVQPQGRRQFEFAFSTIDAGPFGGRRQEVRFFENRASKFVPELATEKDGKQQEKSSTVHALYTCMHGLVQDLRQENRIRIGRGMKRLPPRMRPHRARKDVRLVRRRLSDVRKLSVEEARLRGGPRRNSVRIRKVGEAGP